MACGFRILSHRGLTEAGWEGNSLSWLRTLILSLLHLGLPRRRRFTGTRRLSRPEGKDSPKGGCQHSRFLTEARGAFCFCQVSVQSSLSNQVWFSFLPPRPPRLQSVYAASFPFTDIFCVCYFHQNLGTFIALSPTNNASFWTFLQPEYSLHRIMCIDWADFPFFPNSQKQTQRKSWSIWLDI